MWSHKKGTNWKGGDLPSQGTTQAGNLQSGALGVEVVGERLGRWGGGQKLCICVLDLS